MSSRPLFLIVHSHPWGLRCSPKRGDVSPSAWRGAQGVDGDFSAGYNSEIYRGRYELRNEDWWELVILIERIKSE